MVSSSSINDTIEDSKGQIVELPPIPTNVFDHEKPREVPLLLIPRTKNVMNM